MNLADQESCQKKQTITPPRRLCYSRAGAHVRANTRARCRRFAIRQSCRIGPRIHARALQAPRRRVMRATGVKPGLVDAAVALHLETHRFAIDDDGKVHVLGPSGTVTDALQAAVRWIERDEHRDLKGGTVAPEEGEFTRMVAALRN